MKSYIETMFLLFKLLTGFAIALGTLIILKYCSSINFYPKGIEIGDGLFFIWMSLLFGVRYLLIVLTLAIFGFAFYVLIRNLAHKLFGVSPHRIKLSDPLFWGAFMFTSIVLTLLYLVVHPENFELTLENANYFIGIVGTIVISGLLFSFLMEPKGFQKNQAENNELDENSDINLDEPIFDLKHKRHSSKIDLSLVFLLFTLPMFMLNGFVDRATELAMLDLGIKKNSMSLYLHESSSKYVSGFLTEKERCKYMTPVPDGGNRVDDVTIEFQGIGDKSYIKIFKGDSYLYLSLPSNHFVAAELRQEQESEKYEKEMTDCE